jgi:hypothetical protein
MHHDILISESNQICLIDANIINNKLKAALLFIHLVNDLEQIVVDPITNQKYHVTLPLDYVTSMVETIDNVELNLSTINEPTN